MPCTEAASVHGTITPVDGRYADAKVIVLIMDNLNTHTLRSLYEAYLSAEARRLAPAPGDPL